MTIEKPPQRCRYPQEFCQNVGGFGIHRQGFLGPNFWKK